MASASFTSTARSFPFLELFFRSRIGAAELLPFEGSGSLLAKEIWAGSRGMFDASAEVETITLDVDEDGSDGAFSFNCTSLKRMRCSVEPT
ncbi:hypothetical protein PAXRUDRAFT_504557 [Paxillus rubicundulus Ve08.2h10]|uniref:Uncharacterized protein n=1 Tax=Paxillus rubicundulus Ve08.2h10 TaxID=930991 RepID=A0A0D0DLL3_9AGAM|nr:hypothetical protein PAXRUDRAFT_504557 [Paxillus rubicundulus Ve08.2h10]